MESPRLGKTILEQIPKEFGSKKSTHGLFGTVLGSMFIILLFAAFWVYREHRLSEKAPVVVPVQETPAKNAPTLDDVQELLSDTEIPAFHETL